MLVDWLVKNSRITRETGELTVDGIGELER